jgi:hypothetical protein
VRVRVPVAVRVGVKVRVGVSVNVLVASGVRVRVGDCVRVGVRVAVLRGVLVPVCVRVCDCVGVAVRVPVAVAGGTAVAVGVLLAVAVMLAVLVRVPVAVRVAVEVRLGVALAVVAGVWLAVGVPSCATTCRVHKRAARKEADRCVQRGMRERLIVTTYLVCHDEANTDFLPPCSVASRRNGELMNNPGSRSALRPRLRRSHRRQVPLLRKHGQGNSTSGRLIGRHLAESLEARSATRLDCALVPIPASRVRWPHQ